MAYGARLESVLGASPQGFESPILRQKKVSGSESADLVANSQLGFRACSPTHGSLGTLKGPFYV